LLGLLLATCVFAASVTCWFLINGSGVPGDTGEVVAPGTALLHGEPKCAYPPQLHSSVPPLYPLFEAGAMAITGIGRTGVPPGWETNPRCGPARPVPGHRSTAIWPILAIGLLMWPALLLGFHLVIRASRRGHTRWEILGACLLAAMPQLTGPLVEFFHPEDLLAMALILASVAAAIRSRWLAAGILIGLACGAKQYAALAAVPLVVSAPSGGRLRSLVAGVATLGSVAIVLRLLMGGGLVTAWGGGNATPASRGTAVDLLGLHGAGLTLVARVAPLVVAGLVAWWARGRLGSRTCEPVPLLALVTTGLALRLVFEVNLYGYYLMAACVGLITLDVAAGRLRSETIGWVILSAALYPPDVESIAALRPLVPWPWPVPLAVAVSGVVVAALPLVHRLRRPQQSAP
jgi:hypothetical protein